MPGRRKPRVACHICVVSEMIEGEPFCDKCWKAWPAWFRRKVNRLNRAIDPWCDRRRHEWREDKIEAEREQFEPAYKAYRRAHALMYKLAVRTYRRDETPEQLEAREAINREILERAQAKIDSEKEIPTN